MTEPLPLSDVTVIDLTIARAGPTAVRQLADWGANVVRVESPEGGFEAGGRSSPDYLNLHRNKRSLIVDLKHPDGRAALHRLVQSADVLVENMRSAVKYKLGFDFESLSKVNPRIILGSISGFGQDGPYGQRGGVDQIAQGLGGMMSVTGLPEQGPVRAGVAISDITAGLQLAIGILTALHERQRTGKGRWVHTSLLESMIGMLDFQAARWTVAGDNPPQEGNDHPTLGPMGMYKTRDGYINLAASGGRLWEAFCRELGVDSWLDDPRFSTVSSRRTNKAELNQLIEARLHDDTSENWVIRLNAVGVPCGPVNTVAEVFDDPQVKYLEMAKPVEHPISGHIEILKNATNIEGVSSDIRMPSPLKGEHSRELLSEFGFTQDEIDRLAQSEAVQVHPE
ncbi:MAG: CaiB/BaiF CoA transferase family protein [Acidimicrobiales bacterium]|jgi:crotonobetainyl-CoA:carnitine CoA-transferase CaiB-like acyl-CoA transferase|nr:formyl-CoA transferase [Acidimicrobiaceae bacterium]MBR81712.1 formyl-CoA transferase [Acidimicrobiaceae bacterium]MEC7426622.1 CoA transferase [Actinomycetota bacterium]|tara:strand:+ start:125 stop:1312 length:1188 start_codon:yes stop_codon:yes gene_type:complete